MSFLSMVFFERTTFDLQEGLAAIFASEFPDTQFSFVLSGEKAGDPVIVMVDHHVYLVLPIEAAPPMEEFEWAAQQSLVWPAGSEAIAKTGAHVIISCQPAEEADPLVVARGLTMLMGAACRLPGAIAGHWGVKARNLLPPLLVVKAAEDAYRRVWPAILWHRIAYFEIARKTSLFQRLRPSSKPGKESARWGMTTVGLSEFVGREVEMEVELSNAQESAFTLLDVSPYILDNWKKIKHNDTMGGTEQGNWVMRVNMRDEALSGDGASYLLVRQTVN